MARDVAADFAGVELIVARNPDVGSSLPYLLWVPLGDGLVFRTKGTWPRTAALYCHPVEREEWPAEPEIVERVRLRACSRRGAAIDVICDRGREQRSQIVFTRARGREMVFWQSPRTRKQARPQVRLPSARAQGIEQLEIVVDAHERYPYRFAAQQVSTVRRALAAGDYAIIAAGRVIAAVERKSLEDLASSLVSGRLRYALGELSSLPRAAVVVEDRYSRAFSHAHVRASTLLDGIAELQVRWPAVPIVFCETRKLAEEWTYRYLAAAHAWAIEGSAAVPWLASAQQDADEAPAEALPPTRELRAWARVHGLAVSDRGRLPPEIEHAWRQSRQGPD